MEKAQLGQVDSEQKTKKQTESDEKQKQTEDNKKEATIKKEQTKFVNDILKNFQN